MQQHRNIAKQTAPLKDRLIAFKTEIQRKASRLSDGSEREDLFKKLEQIDQAMHLAEWLHSPELRQPK